MGTLRLKKLEGRDMAQWLRSLVDLPEDLGLIPSIDMASHNCM